MADFIALFALLLTFSEIRLQYEMYEMWFIEYGHQIGATPWHLIQSCTNSMFSSEIPNKVLHRCTTTSCKIECESSQVVVLDAVLGMIYISLGAKCVRRLTVLSIVGLYTGLLFIQSREIC